MTVEMDLAERGQRMTRYSRTDCDSVDRVCERASEILNDGSWLKVDSWSSFNLCRRVSPDVGHLVRKHPHGHRQQSRDRLPNDVLHHDP
jgi:hypothetical protein